MVQQFTVTWESAVALIERGLPFALTVTQPSSAHQQAVIGYDSRCRAFIYRDPYMPYSGEYQADGFLEGQRSTGPVGMVLVPRDRVQLLDGLALPDAAQYDRVYELRRALEVHDRPAAQAAVQALEQQAPGHRLTFLARRLLADYDDDQAELLRAVDALLGLYPDDGVLLLGKLACLQHLGRREERLEVLRRASERKDANPVFWRHYARELSADARESHSAARWLRRALRAQPADAGNLSQLANLIWDQGQWEKAFELYRFAACLGDKDETSARSYFLAARHLKQVDATLAFLRKRFVRFGAQSSQPACTLFWAYSLQERMLEAFAVLDQAIALRPDDGELLLFAAGAHSDHGQFAQASALLAQGQGKAPRTTWLRSAARLASAQGELQTALEHWRGVLAIEPLALDAHRAAAMLLAETESRAAALVHLRQACERFPHNYPLRQMLIEWLREEERAVREAATRKMLAIHPADAWARRELASLLSHQGRHEEAFAELEIARSLEPTSAAYWNVRGVVCTAAGRPEEARQAYREAVRLAVDNHFAMYRLLELCETLAERRQALAFIKDELVRQVTFGDGLLAYHDLAGRTVEPDELLALLRDALAARPDLWHAWSVLAQQLTQMRRLDEALDLARQATARFPLLPRLWLDLAAVCEARQDADGEREALEHALAISPSWGTALRHLAEIHERAGRLDEAQTVLERTVAREPLDARNHGCLADILWKRDHKEEALERVQKALLADPGYNWGWDALRHWARRLGRPEAAAAVARDLTGRRGGEARSWLLLARTLDRPEDLDERLAALQHALALNPRCVDAYDLKAELLAGAERYEEAAAACHPEIWGAQPPLILRGRAAWVEAQRGHTPQAIVLMRDVVAVDPDYYWAWYQLAEWYDRSPEHAEYLNAASQLVRLAPDSAVPYGFRGDARLRNGDRAGAVADFQRSIELDPTYAFGGLSLFDVQFDDADWSAAAATLEHLRRHIGDDYVEAREVRWAAYHRRKEEALDHFRDLTLSACSDNWPLDHSVDVLWRAGLWRSAERVLQEALDSPSVHPRVAELWIELRTRRGAWHVPRQLDGLLARGEVGRLALIALVCALGKARRKWRLRQVVRRYRETFRVTQNWGKVGYAFALATDDRRLIAFLSDWRERPDVEPWMLLNLALSLRALGRDTAASEVSRHALTLPRDTASPCHEVWLALDSAVAGQFGKAADALGAIDSEAYDASHRFLHALVRGLVALHQVTPSERGRVFASVRAQWQTAVLDSTPMDEDRAAVRHAYRRSVRRLAADTGSWLAWLWALWRTVAPRIPPALAPQ
jgi:tetratricopeptide (TPR) repeat protein